MQERRAPARRDGCRICHSCRAGARRSGAKCVHGDAITRDSMLDRAERPHLFWNESEKLLCGGSWGGGRAIQFNIRKFPKVRVDDAFGSLAHEEFAAVLNDERGEAARGGGGSFVEVGKFIHVIVLKSEAVF